MPEMIFTAFYLRPTHINELMVMRMMAPIILPYANENTYLYLSLITNERLISDGDKQQRCKSLFEDKRH